MFNVLFSCKNEKKKKTTQNGLYQAGCNHLLNVSQQARISAENVLVAYLSCASLL